MTREEAIADIRDNIKPIVGGKSLDMAIEALEHEPCDDAISRQAVAEVLLKYAHSTEGKAFAEFLISQINALPPVTPQPKMGRWINAKVGKMFHSNDYKCSECGNILNFDGVNCGRGDANYCPNCGAKMEV